MTEKEIQQQISDYEWQIVSVYNNLRSAAREVGVRGFQAAQYERQIAISKATGNKTKNTLFPLLISVAGFYMLYASVILGLFMLVGGIVLAYKKYTKADKELRDVQSQYDRMVSVAEAQQRTLNSILDRNTTI